MLGYIRYIAGLHDSDKTQPHNNAGQWWQILYLPFGTDCAV